MARVTLDADIVIAFLDSADDHHATAVAELRPRLAAGDELLVAATVYAESIVRPLQQGTDGTVDEFFDAAGISIVPIDRAVARALLVRTWRCDDAPIGGSAGLSRGSARGGAPSSHARWAA